MTNLPKLGQSSSDFETFDDVLLQAVSKHTTLKDFIDEPLADVHVIA